MRTSNRDILIAAALAAAIATACSKPAEAPGAAAPAAAEPAPAASVAAPAAKASGEKLAWLAGNWCGQDEGQSLEERWTMPHANEAIGMGSTVSGGRIISFEYMRILELEGTITFIAQPSGDPPTSFKRSDGGDDWISFENKEHDYPQRIEYRRVGEGLKAEIGGPGAEGKEEVIAYNYTRCPAN